MKSLIVLLRIIIVGALWGIVFTEGIRVIMLCNWHFDIFWPDHWRQAKELWQAGWVVRAPKEWAFVIILVTFFPMLITGWWTLCLVAWEDIIGKILMLPVRLYQHFIKTPLNVMTTNNKYGVVKKKSYKQVRPLGVIGSIRSPISDYSDTAKPNSAPYVPAYTAPKPTPQPTVKTDVSATIDHALFKFDDDDDDDFDLDIDSFEKADIKKERGAEENKGKDISKKENKFDFDDDEPKPRDNRRSQRHQDKIEDKENRRDNNRGGKTERVERDKNKRFQETDEAKPTGGSNKGPVFETLQQKGYDIIENVTVKSSIVDFIGVSENKICLCLVDKESGDWLADEELFNGEEPLWFSESSHRVSPVRKLLMARDAAEEQLKEEGFKQTIEAFVVVQMANIINADDMFDVWENMNINVTRINRGAPKEIQLFSKTLTEADGSLPRKELDRLRKVLKNIK